MRSAMLHFAKYMASYTALMIVAYALWQAAGCPAVDDSFAAGSFQQVAFSLSNFLIAFAVAAYPLYAVIEAALRRIPRGGARGRERDRKVSTASRRAMSR